ncbi:amino acid permease 3-like isoform X2 [Panicum miliaceum]|uniref:Amino acid permease 3-like isoform X2 n=1 Tax=Panicum miliaceum TaxID=4540 RepID=A0A3L6TBV8_PANMI|nr:amino acid permease 3-like isoform X2 [Panicum miliaceum]
MSEQLIGFILREILDPKEEFYYDGHPGRLGRNPTPSAAAPSQVGFPISPPPEQPPEVQLAARKAAAGLRLPSSILSSPPPPPRPLLVAVCGGGRSQQPAAGSALPGARRDGARRRRRSWRGTAARAAWRGGVWSMASVAGAAGDACCCGPWRRGGGGRYITVKQPVEGYIGEARGPVRVSNTAVNELGAVRRGGPMSLGEGIAATSRASAYIITAVMGSGVLTLGSAMSQLGWVLGPAAMVLFALLVTYYASALLADCYDRRTPSQAATAGESRYTYMDAIRDNLPAGGGTIKAKICVVLLYANMVNVVVGYTITASNAMMAMKRSKCFSNSSQAQARYMMVIFGGAQILLSLIPGFDHISCLSVLAAVMSLTYATIGLGLGTAQVVANKGFKGTLTGMLSIGGVTPMGKAWRSLQALGTVAFACSYSHVLFDVRGTIRGPEARAVMRGASRLSAAVTALFYTLCGVVGYAAFGVTAPEDLLFGFSRPAWVLDAARAAAIVHLAGAYQVCRQPLFAFAEDWAQRRWPQPRCINTKLIRRLACRKAFVVVTTATPILLPSPIAQYVLGLLSALAFWPLTIYFPMYMHIASKKLHKWSLPWVALQLISIFCLAITAATAVRCLAGIISPALRHTN